MRLFAKPDCARQAADSTESSGYSCDRGFLAVDSPRAHPVLLTADEAADLLRTTRRAVYIMVERRQLPGITRIGRRVLFRSADLLDWLDQKRAPLPEE